MFYPTIEPGWPETTCELTPHGDVHFTKWGVWKAWSSVSLQSRVFAEKRQALDWLEDYPFH